MVLYIKVNIAWHAAVHGVAESDRTEQMNCIELIHDMGLPWWLRR